MNLFALHGLDLAAAALTFVLSLALTWRFSRPQSRLFIIDEPNTRSLHSIPVPRSGGVAINLAVLAGALVLVGAHGAPRYLIGLGAAAAMIAIISFIDDVRTLPARYRFPVQFAAFVVAGSAGLLLDRIVAPGVAYTLPSALGWLASGLFVLWMTNLYNFMDGMDGFAGGMALIGFGCFAVMGAAAGQPLFAGLCLTLAAGAAGFLCLNFPPAKIFMGDTGSSVLGFCAGALSIWADRERIFPLWIAMVVFSPFIVDASVTLVRRALHRDNIFVAHRSHFYQRVVASGWSHRRTVGCEYALMLACTGCALAMNGARPLTQWLLLAAVLGVQAGLMLGVHRAEQSRDHGHR